MASRLGDILYWLGCAAAIAVIAVAAALWLTANPVRTDAGEISLVFVGIAVLIWAAGRACRYVLAGR